MSGPEQELHPGTAAWRELDSQIVHGPLFHPQLHTGDFYREVDRMAQEGGDPAVVKKIIDHVIGSPGTKPPASEAGAEDAMHQEFWEEHDPNWRPHSPDDEHHLT